MFIIVLTGAIDIRQNHVYNHKPPCLALNLFGPQFLVCTYISCWFEVQKEIKEHVLDSLDRTKPGIRSIRDWVGWYWELADFLRGEKRKGKLDLKRGEWKGKKDGLKDGHVVMGFFKA